MMGSVSRWLPLSVVSCLALLVLGAPVASGKVPGPNGRIAFAREIPALDGDTATFTVDPDGTSSTRLLPGGSGGPHWSPDGSEIGQTAAAKHCSSPRWTGLGRRNALPPGDYRRK